MTRRANKSTVHENVAMPISVARGRLFELAEDILTHRTDRVTLSHKDYDEGLVLLRSSELAKMDADMAALRNSGERTPFSLRGIGTIIGDPEDVLTESRERQAALWEAKLKSFSDESGEPTN